MEQAPEFLTLEAVADMLKVGVPTVQSLVDRGLLDLPPFLVPIIMGVEPLRAAGQTPAASGFLMHYVVARYCSRAATPR